MRIGVVIILGLANLFGSGLSMGMGDYLSSKAEHEFQEAERKREKWECDNYLEGEKNEMVEIYMSKGLPEADARAIVNILSKHTDSFVEIMMVEELGIMPPGSDDSPAKEGLVTFLSFIFFGAIPLLPYLIGFAFEGRRVQCGIDVLFGAAVGGAAFTLSMLGAVTSRFMTQAWYKAGFVMLVNGAFAAGIAFLIGWGLDKLGMNGADS